MLSDGNNSGVKSSEFIVFYDWASAKIVRKIELTLKRLFWSTNDLLTLASPDEFYVLQFKKEVRKNSDGLFSGNQSINRLLEECKKLE